jgi:hypothetical protein
MPHEPRHVTFLERDGRLKHYGIGLRGQEPRPALAGAVRTVAADAVPGDAYGFTIAHDAAFSALGLVYWWADENEIHHRVYAAPLDDPAALEPVDGTGMACVWELEVIDFERRAWLEEVLKRGNTDAYLEQALETVDV